MLFNFERFTECAKLAYRHFENSPYSLNDVLAVFKYYFETYEYVLGQVHPPIKVKQIRDIIMKMPFFDERGINVDLTVEDYEILIDQHFVTDYRECDYNVIHFFSGKIRELRYYENFY